MLIKPEDGTKTGGTGNSNEDGVIIQSKPDHLVSLRDLNASF